MLKLFVRYIKKKQLNKKYQGLNIGAGTHYSIENLDGIAPQLATIGRRCVFAPKSVVLTHDASLLPMTGKYIFKKTYVGDNVFIGYGAVIMPGVRVGDNSIIGSNSVVTKDIDSGCVVAGVPARFICKTSELIQKRSGDLIDSPCDYTKGLTEADILNIQKTVLKIF